MGAKSSSLHNSLLEGEWGVCRRTLTRKDRLRFVTCKDRNLLNNTVLHTACCVEDVPIDVTESIHRVHANLISMPNDQGYVPLHIACVFASYDVVSFLLNEAPNTTTVRVGTLLPLHQSIVERRSSRVIQRLLEVHPSSVYAAVGSLFETSIHLFVHCWKDHLENAYLKNRERLRESANERFVGEESTLETFRNVLHFLVGAYVGGGVDECLSFDDSSSPSLLLMHEAFKIRNVTIPPIFVRALSETVPDVCAQSDKKGNFLLHTACL